MTRDQRRAGLVLGAIFLGGCVPQGHMTVASGDNQIGAPGATLAPLAVTVLDSKGAPSSGVPVSFKIASGGGSLASAVVKTDAQGHAQTELTLGAAGTVLVTATAPLMTAPVRFQETALGVPGTFTLLDGFEAPGAPAPWIFGADKGAKGSLSSGTGLTGKGAHLVYDFTSGGAWTSATVALATPSVAAEVAFEVRSGPGIRIHLRVQDTTGQELEYALARPLEAIDPTAWYRHVVELDAPTVYQGGANDGVVHGIAKLAILATDPIEPGAVGAIDLDDVGTIDVKELDAAGLTPLAAPAGSLALTDGLGVAIHFTQDDKALDAAKAAGFTLVRMDLAWNWIETKVGVYDFSAFDALLASLDARGMKALFILDYGNPLHEDGPGWAPQSTATITAFGDYVQAAATHFAGRGVCYEVWNEPNLPIYWKPIPLPANYTRLCQEAITRAHAGDPTALVSTGGLSGFDFPFMRSIVALGAAQGAAAVGVHPYRKDCPETVSDELLLWRSVAGTAWSTEWGYDAAALPDVTTQGKWVVRELLAEKALGLPIAVDYEIQDDSSGRFGILDASYADKPASVALKTLAAASAGRVFAGFLVGGPTSIHVLELDGAQDKVYVLWSDAVGGGAAITFPAGATAVDCFGGAVAPFVSGGKVAFAVGEAAGPIYVTVP
jgi:hypothetical protein